MSKVIGLLWVGANVRLVYCHVGHMSDRAIVYPSSFCGFLPDRPTVRMPYLIMESTEIQGTFS